MAQFGFEVSHNLNPEDVRVSTDQINEPVLNKVIKEERADNYSGEAVETFSIGQNSVFVVSPASEPEPEREADTEFTFPVVKTEIFDFENEPIFHQEERGGKSLGNEILPGITVTLESRKKKRKHGPSVCNAREPPTRFLLALKKFRAQKKFRTSVRIKCQSPICAVRNPINQLSLEYHLYSHLGKAPLFLCALCGAETRYFNNHAKDVHNLKAKEAAVHKIDNRKKYEDKLVEILNTCFPLGQDSIFHAAAPQPLTFYRKKTQFLWSKIRGKKSNYRRHHVPWSQNFPILEECVAIACKDLRANHLRCQKKTPSPCYHRVAEFPNRKNIWQHIHYHYQLESGKVSAVETNKIPAQPMPKTGFGPERSNIYTMQCLICGKKARAIQGVVGHIVKLHREKAEVGVNYVKLHQQETIIVEKPREPTKTLKCLFCNGLFLGRAGIASHLRSQHNETQLEEGKNFINLSLAFPTVNQLMETEEATSKIGNKSPNESILTPFLGNELQPNLVMIFRCLYCSKALDTKRHLLYHIRLQHSIGEAIEEFNYRTEKIDPTTEDPIEDNFGITKEELYVPRDAPEELEYIRILYECFPSRNFVSAIKIISEDSDSFKMPKLLPFELPKTPASYPSKYYNLIGTIASFNKEHGGITCSICGKHLEATCHTHHISGHVLSHLEKPLYRCRLCQQDFSHVRQSRAHVQKEHPEILKGNLAMALEDLRFQMEDTMLEVARKAFPYCVTNESNFIDSTAIEQMMVNNSSQECETDSKRIKTEIDESHPETSVDETVENYGVFNEEELLGMIDWKKGIRSILKEEPGQKMKVRKLRKKLLAKVAPIVGPFAFETLKEKIWQTLLVYDRITVSDEGKYASLN